jgi:hypothetical protein
MLRKYVSVVLFYLFMLSRRSHRLPRYRKVPRHHFDNFPPPSVESSRRRLLAARRRHAHLHGIRCRVDLAAGVERARRYNTVKVQAGTLSRRLDIVSPSYLDDRSSHYPSPLPSHSPTMLVSSAPVLIHLDVVMLDLSR